MTLDAPDGPTAPRPTFEEGMDMLWRFQLRKEHTALLEKQDAANKQLQQLNADVIKNKKNFDERMAGLEAQTIKNKKDFGERLAALETTILNLQSEERRDRHAFEKYGEEMATLRSQIGDVRDKVETRDLFTVEGISFLSISSDYLLIVAGQVLGPYTGVPSSLDGPEPAFEPPRTTSHTTHNTKNDNPRPAPTSIKTSKHVQIPVPAPNTTASFHATNRAVNIVSETVGPVSRSRSRSRTRSQSAEVPTIKQPLTKTLTPASRTPATGPSSARTPTLETFSKLPRLHQGHSSYKAYLDKATSTFECLPRPVDRKVEIEFISQFIKGITNEDKRNNLTAELQQQHQSRRKKGGKIEILCEWNDIAEGMKAVGLLQTATAGVRSKPKDKHRGSQFKNELKGLLDS